MFYNAATEHTRIVKRATEFNHRFPDGASPRAPADRSVRESVGCIDALTYTRERLLPGIRRRGFPTATHILEPSMR